MKQSFNMTAGTEGGWTHKAPGEPVSYPAEGRKDVNVPLHLSCDNQTNWRSVCYLEVCVLSESRQVCGGAPSGAQFIGP